jgi:cell division control protein 6
VDPLDVISVAAEEDTDQDDDEDDAMDIQKTPTKPRTRGSQYSKGLYTPPASSPSPAVEVKVNDAAKRIELIRMQSSTTSISTSTSTSTSSNEEERTSGNPYKYLKSFLRLSTSGNDELDKVIVGRSIEKETLKAYLASEERQVGMYVSGPPGTGKTALVTALGREMGGAGWGVVEIGCMGLKAADMWRRLGEELGCAKTEAGVIAHIESLHGDL